MLLWTLFVIFAVYFYVRVIKPHSHWRNRGIPYKTPWPVVGNMLSNVFRKISSVEYFVELYNEASGRYLGLYQFLQPVLLLKDPEVIKQVTVKDFDNFVDRQDFVTEEMDPLFGKNLFALKGTGVVCCQTNIWGEMLPAIVPWFYDHILDKNHLALSYSLEGSFEIFVGQRWRHMRSTLSPAFTGSKMRAMFTLMWDCAEQYTDYFIKQSKIEPVSIEMKDTFTRFANDVIATCAFGFKCDSINEKDNDFYRNGFEATDFSGLKIFKFSLYAISPTLSEFFKIKIFNESIANFFRKIVGDTIEMREKEGIVRPDMIHLLMEARKGLLKHEEKKDEDAGFATVEESQVGRENVSKELSMDDITAQAVLFFFAGFDTITGVMCHLAHELAINPDIQQRLQAEIDETFEQNQGKISYDAIMKMKYLDMVVSEGLRKWPTVTVANRVCSKPYTLPPVEDGGEPIQLEKGDILWLPIFPIHHCPDYYPNPEKFDPERFNEDNKDNIKASTYFPFGSGPRNCIGSRFALLELKTIFVNFLKMFDIVVTDRTQIPLKLKLDSFNLNAEKGFWLGLRPRISS